jgi:hypothetical protein
LLAPCGLRRAPFRGRVFPSAFVLISCPRPPLCRGGGGPWAGPRRRGWLCSLGWREAGCGLCWRLFRWGRFPTWFARWRNWRGRFGRHSGEIIAWRFGDDRQPLADSDAARPVAFAAKDIIHLVLNAGRAAPVGNSKADLIGRVGWCGHGSPFFLRGPADCLGGGRGNPSGSRGARRGEVLPSKCTRNNVDGRGLRVPQLA